MPNSEHILESDPIRVLIVEVDEVGRIHLQSLLSQGGFSLCAAATVDSGLREVLRHHCDVVVMGPYIAMGEGPMFIEEAKRICPWLGIVWCVGDREGAECGAETCFNKIVRAPLRPVELSALVRSVSVECRAQFERKAAQLPRKVENQLDILRQLTDVALNQQSLWQAVKSLALGLEGLVASDVIGVLVKDVESGWILLLHANRPQSRSMVSKVKREMLIRYESLAGEALSEGQLHVEMEGRIEGDEDVELQHVITVPVLAQNALQGLLTLAGRSQARLSKTYTAFLYHTANHLSTILLALNQMRHLAIRDPLTGSYSRRFFDIELPRLWNLAARKRNTVGLLLVDIDYLKEINDSFGHTSGDRTIVEFFELLRKTIRETDLIFRLGGDEFLILLPQTSSAEAEHLAIRIHETVRTHDFVAVGKVLHLTASLGLSVAEPALTTLNHTDLLEKADKALYLSKRNGRDRYSVCEAETSTGEHRDPEADDPPAREKPVSSARDQPRILVVDDDPLILSVLELSLTAEGYIVEKAPGVSEAEAILRRRGRPFELLITDLSLPARDGFDMLRVAKEIDPNMVRIVVTGHVTADNAIAALRGGAYDFMEKPISRSHLLALVERALEYRRLSRENYEYQHYLEGMVRQKNVEVAGKLEELKVAYEFSLNAMVAMLDAWEFETSRHSKRVMRLTELLARHVGIQDPLLSQIVHGALLHDIGKIGIPDHILKKPGPLTSEERRVMRKHPEIGHRFIQASPYLHEASEIVLCHHEAYNGGGYPRGLTGKDIPLGARIFSVVDTYDAMRSPRVYKPSIPVAEACAEIQAQSGLQFDPAMVLSFLEILPEVERLGQWTSVFPEPEVDEDGDLNPLAYL